jgi:hypothetical protein
LEKWWKYERVALWVIVAGLAIFTLSLNGSIGSVEKEVTAQATKLERTVVQAEVLPGLPGDLATMWKKARSSATGVVADDYLWLTARVANTGFDAVNEMSVDLSVLPTIAQVFAYTADGKALNASWGGPEIKKGGQGKHSVSVAFPGLEPGKRNLLFIGIKRNDPAVAAVSDPAAWADANRHYWERLAVQTRPGAWADFTLADAEYGFAAPTAATAAAPQDTDKAAGPSTSTDSMDKAVEPSTSTGSTEKAPG